MKSYTDLEQSKKLAKILPRESADMHYNNGCCRGVDYIEPFSAELMPYQEALHLMKIHKTNFMFQVIPCWSLAALLDVLPNYQLQTQDDGIGILCSYNGKFNIVTADNPVDACVGLIIKLKEQNLI